MRNFAYGLSGMWMLREVNGRSMYQVESPILGFLVWSYREDNMVVGSVAGEIDFLIRNRVGRNFNQFCESVIVDRDENR